MPYTESVKFSKVDRFGCGPMSEDDVYTIQAFVNQCRGYGFIDSDGYGHPVKDGLADTQIEIKPSRVLFCIPSDATHIVWYNR